MTWTVSLTSRAELQLYDAALWWAENRSTEQAVRWTVVYAEGVTEQSPGSRRFAAHPGLDDR